MLDQVIHTIHILIEAARAQLIERRRSLLRASVAISMLNVLASVVLVALSSLAKEN